MIKRANAEDTEILAALAIQMWTGHNLEDLAEEFRKLVMNEEAVCFIKYEDEKPIGFAQCQLRYDYVEGTESSPVGYLEGILIVDRYRKKGYAAELLAECEKWAKEKGCSEFASDCELVNEESLKFHMALGFEEANRIICFRKDI
jgi:aminoglycoside 6'-N-acetyltransferase I